MPPTKQPTTPHVRDHSLNGKTFFTTLGAVGLHRDKDCRKSDQTYYGGCVNTSKQLLILTSRLRCYTNIYLPWSTNPEQLRSLQGVSIPSNNLQQRIFPGAHASRAIPAIRLPPWQGVDQQET
eukprot:3012425-Pyramimonas_sp.AAC.1